jgi:transposase
MEDALSVTSLPDDPAALKQIILSLSHQRDKQIGELDSKTRRIVQLQNTTQQLEIEKLRLEVELLRLKKLYYGPRADRLCTPGDVAQMLLEFASDLESRPVNPQDLPPSDPPPSPQTSAQTSAVRRVRRGRRNLSDFNHLPVVRHVHDLDEDQKPCSCCGKVREKIGEESSWQVEYIPGHFERLEHVRIKYACKCCEQNAENPRIEVADKPQQPIDKGMAGPGLLAYVITSKYADYLPLYRLESIFERNGFEIDRATQSVWCGDVADLIKPLYDLMTRRVLLSHVICTDDTVMPMLAPEKARQARMWVYIGDEHNPYNLFDFTLGRGRDGPVAFLKEYKQTLLADAYGGYDGVVVGNEITRAGCMAHARRKFVDAEKTHPAIAAEAVGIIRQLYAIEDKARGKSDEDRLCLRRQETQPILAALREKLWAWKDRLLPKHPMAEAIGYMLNQWKELNVFAGDGAVPIDNNVSERDIKRIVLNRKNSLFVGNERGGHTAAILSSITSTCRRHGIDPQRYLTQLLTNLPRTPISQVERWLPDQWKQRQPTYSA